MKASTLRRRHRLDAWDPEVCDALIQELWTLRAAMLQAQAPLEPSMKMLGQERAPSAVNLAHYLAMRQFDLRTLQEGLGWLGVSSLAHGESHMLANVDKALGVVHRLAGRPWVPMSDVEPIGAKRGRALLQRHTVALFGPPTDGREVRIMVTVPSEAAVDPALARGLVDGGMDVARINCAHDDAAAWVAMVRHVREAARQAGRNVRVLMDLGGPKLRTGPMAEAPAVVRIKPERDAFGRVTQAARVIFCLDDNLRTASPGEISLGAKAQGVGSLAVGDLLLNPCSIAPEITLSR